MTSLWPRIFGWMTLILAFFLCGCSTSKQQARQQAVAHWQQVRTGVTLQMARQQLEKGQVEQARASLTEALRANPDDAQLHLLMARALFELRQTSEAQAELALARSLAPDLAEIDYWTGVLAQAAGQWEQAHDAYLVASTRAPESVDYLCVLLEAKLALGRTEEVIDLASRRFRALPGEPRLRILVAQAAAQQGDLGRAIALYEQAVTLDPASIQAREGHAQLLCLAGRHEQAAELLQRLQDDPAAGKDLRLALAACHVACGRYEKAERIYERCLADDPDAATVRLRLNQARLLSGQGGRVRTDLQAMLERMPNDPQAWELLGHACALEGDMTRARAAYSRAVECGGNETQLQEFIRLIDQRAQAARGMTPAAPRTLDPQAVTRVD